MMHWKIYAICVMATVVAGQSSLGPPPVISPEDRQFRVVYEWNTIDFAYRTDAERLNAIYSGKYSPNNVIISDVKAYANRLYLTLPRMLSGVPATLGYVISPNDDGRTDPLIEPFPSWEMNQIGNCSALQFVQGIAIDSDGRMWVVDSGRIDTLSQTQTNKFTCPPKLVILDLGRDGVEVERYEFPHDVVARGTNYVNKIVVDDAFGGFAYITDNSGSDPGIVVFSRRLHRAWKVREDNTMRAAQNAQNFAVNGTQLNFAIHIDGIALGPYYNPNTGTATGPTQPLFKSSNDNYERNVYYSPLSSYHLYSIPASLLRDPEFIRRASKRDILESVTDYGVKDSQTDGMIMDNYGVLYFGLLKDHAIAMWDSYKPFVLENQQVIAKDDSFIQWTDGMSIDENGFLFVVINRLHNFVAGRLNVNDINFRILRAKTGTLSYVQTVGFGADVTPPRGTNGGVNLEIFDNGISSTYSPLAGANRFNGASNLSISNVISFILPLLGTIFFARY